MSATQTRRTNSAAKQICSINLGTAVFCGQNLIDTQYYSSYTPTVKKQCLINYINNININQFNSINEGERARYYVRNYLAQVPGRARIIKLEDMSAVQIAEESL